MNKILFAAALAALMLSCGGRPSKNPAPEPEPVSEETLVPEEPLHGPDSLNDVAALFSGLPVDSTSALFAETKSAVWKRHSEVIGKRWKPCRPICR